MSLAIIVTLFQCSGLKVTEMQHHPPMYPTKKEADWKYLYMEIPTFCIEEALLWFFEEELFLKH